MGSTHNQAAQTAHSQTIHAQPAPAYDWDQLALELSNTAWDTPPESQSKRQPQRHPQPEPHTHPPAARNPLPPLSSAEADDSNSFLSPDQPNARHLSQSEVADSDQPSLAEASDSDVTSPTEVGDSNPEQRDAALLDLLTDPALTIPQLADHIGLTPHQLAEALTAGHLAQLLTAARTIAAARADLIQHQARTDATDALRHIALNESASPETRRMAATALLRETRGPSTEKSTPHQPKPPRHPTDPREDSANLTKETLNTPPARPGTDLQDSPESGIVETPRCTIAARTRGGSDGRSIESQADTKAATTSPDNRGTPQREKPMPIRRAAAVLSSVSLALLAGTTASADIFIWEYIDPNDPSQGRRISTTLAEDGMGVMPAPGADLSELNLDRAWLRGADLTDGSFFRARLDEADFVNADLTNAVLQSMDARDAFFNGANLTNARVSNADLFRSDLSNVTATNADFQSSRLRDVNLSGADLTGASFFRTDINNADFTDAIITGANFSEVRNLDLSMIYATASYADGNLGSIAFRDRDLSGFVLNDQNLQNSVFFSTNLAQSDLRNADFTDARLTNTNLTGADLTGAIFTGADLADVTIAGAMTDAFAASGSLATRIEINDSVFTNADFSNADLFRGEIRNSDFSGADFTGVRMASFFDSSLAGANLTGAEMAGLFGTDLTNANITNADFSRVSDFGFTADQFYSTANYQARDLSGVDLANNDMQGWDFTDQDLTDAGFYVARLQGTDFSNANLSGADLGLATINGTNFTGATNLSAAQIYDTINYRQGNLNDVILGSQDLAGWTFEGIRLHGTNFSNASTAGASFRNADARGAQGLTQTIIDSASDTRNLIRPDGSVPEISVTGADSLSIYNYDGASPDGITVGSRMIVGENATLSFILDTEDWNSTIAFAEPGIEAMLAGFIEIRFDEFLNDAEIEDYFYTDIQLFDWTNADLTFDIRGVIYDGPGWVISRDLGTTGVIQFVPAPGAASVLALGSLGLLRRRR